MRDSTASSSPTCRQRKPPRSKNCVAARGLATIFLLAPTSTPERIRLVAAHSTGFIYLVSITGITGVRNEMPPDLSAFVQRVRKQTDLPLAVGFGIGTRDQAAAVAKAGRRRYRGHSHRQGRGQ